MSEGRPIFVVGAPRSGTTLVKEILNRHPEIHLFDEVHFFERIWDDRHHLGDLADPRHQEAAIGKLRGIVERYGSDQDVAEKLTMESYRRRLAEDGPDYRNLLAILLRTGADMRGARHWGDSSPQDVLYLATILEWFPDARIVAVVRDPRAFLASYKNYHRRNEPGYHERYNALTNSILWKSSMSALLEAERALTGSAILRLRYEDLVTDPERRVRALCDHVGVEWVPAMIEIERTNTSYAARAGYSTAKGISAESLDRWRDELTGTEIWLGERVFGSLLRELGYEPARPRPKPSLAGLAAILAILPGRLYNMLFRGHKPFRLSKVRRVLSNLRSG